MLRFDKLFDIRRTLENVVSNDDLIRAVFEDIPELQEISFGVTNEYDDNNYSDYVRLTAVNGWVIDYEDEYEDGDEQTSDMPKIEDMNKVGTIRDLVQMVGKEFGYNEDHKIDRAYAMRHKNVKKKKTEKAEMKYIMSHFMGKRLPENFFVRVNPKWALYHALDHGRFKPETEFKIFAREGYMRDALRYAQEIVKGPLDEKIENFFILNSEPDSQDYENLKKYLEFKKSITQTV
jgi:hypothetical protein